MRVAVVALLLALASCDQIFGIQRTQPWDAQLPIDAPNWNTSITWATFDHGAVTYDPIDGLAVQVGALDLGSDVTTTSPLTSLAVDATGTFQVPYALAFAPYRVVFIAPDGVPTEIQTSLQGFAWGFPIYGRHARGSAAPGATFSGTISGAGSAVPIRLLTTGLWSVTEGTTSAGAGAFTFPYGSAASLSGALGVLSSSTGDQAIVELGAGSGARAMSVGFGVFPGTIGNAGSATFQPGTTTNVHWPLGANTGTLSTRLTSLADFGTAVLQHYAWVGAIPSVMMPSFVQPQSAGSGTGMDAAAAAVPPPVMLPLDEQNGNSGTMFQNPFDGTVAGSATLAMYEAEIAWRAGSVVAPITSPTYLQATIQSVSLFDGSGSASPPTGAGIVLSEATSPTKLDGVSLTADGQTITRGDAAMLPLVFDTDTSVDDCIVTLYRVVDGAGHTTLSPVARYIATTVPAKPAMANPLMISTQWFDASGVYTFGFHCEVGHVHPLLDYREISAPYSFSASSTFSTLFTVQ